MKRIFYLMLVATTAFVAGCKKASTVSTDAATNTTTTTTTQAVPTTGTAFDKLRDSIYLFAKEDYLWYDAIPDYNTFNPRGFTGTSDLAALQSEVDAISQYKINPVTGKPYEYSTRSPGSAKYSFIDNGQVSSTLAGNSGDFGFSVFYNTYNDLRIKYVNINSPAAAAGLVRGYKVISINGNKNLAYDPNSSNVNADPNLLFVVSALGQSSITLSLQLPDNSIITKTVAVGNYTLNPVLTSKVVDLGNGKKVGYFVFSSFTDPKNAGPPLDSAFAKFTKQGITDLVVDLRYNGGGFTATAEYIDNYIVPPAKNKTTMYSYYYNDKLQKDQYPLLSTIFQINNGDFSLAANTVLFAKKGSLDLKRVFFIVSGSTASASELTINNLIPHMNVFLIGTTSYGKPVGFFGIPFSNGKYQLYIPEFSTKNASGNGDYYSGMTPGSSTYPGVYDYDDVTHDFGDVSETQFKHALSYVNTGTFSISTPQVQSIGGLNTLSATQLSNLTQTLDGKHFKGMIFDKLRRKHK